MMLPTDNEDNHKNVDQENQYPGRDSTTGPRQFDEVVTQHTILRHSHSLFLNYTGQALHSVTWEIGAKNKRGEMWKEENLTCDSGPNIAWKDSVISAQPVI